MLREHTARVMKKLFDLGLVRRNVATKPFDPDKVNQGKIHTFRTRPPVGIMYE